MKTARDCLAAPGTTMNDSIPTGPAAGNLNKSKTCYKCQQEGHVSNLSRCPFLLSDLNAPPCRHRLPEIAQKTQSLPQMCFEVPVVRQSFNEVGGQKKKQTTSQKTTVPICTRNLVIDIINLP
jgi:hypothetical protein